MEVLVINNHPDIWSASSGFVIPTKSPGSFLYQPAPFGPTCPTLGSFNHETIISKEPFLISTSSLAKHKNSPLDK